MRKQSGCLRAVALAYLAGLAGMAWAQEAATTAFASAGVVAIQADGTKRVLTRGDEIRAGETVDTGGGRAQLRFTDGAMVSLQPQTQFRIDAYEFKAQADGSEKGFFSLLKGALRTITGAIGKKDRMAYRLDTAVATIGIRGTSFSVAYGNSITVSTTEGAVEACNNGGCLVVGAGQSAYVKDIDTAPVFLGGSLPPQGGTQPGGPPPQGFTAGDNPNVLTPPLHPTQRIQGPGNY